MTNRVAYAPHDFEQMCKQAERDHESKKLIVLIDRVKKQIAQREHSNRKSEISKPAATGGNGELFRVPSRSVLSER